MKEEMKWWQTTTTINNQPDNNITITAIILSILSILF